MLAAWLRPRAKRCQPWWGRHCQQHSSQQCCHLHHPALHPALLSACRRWGSHCAAFWGCHWKDAVALRLTGWCLSCAPPRAMFDSCKYKPGIDICTPHHVSWHPHLHGMPYSAPHTVLLQCQSSILAISQAFHLLWFYPCLSLRFLVAFCKDAQHFHRGAAAEWSGWAVLPTEGVSAAALSCPGLLASCCSPILIPLPRLSTTGCPAGSVPCSTSAASQSCSGHHSNSFGGEAFLSHLTQADFNLSQALCEASGWRFYFKCSHCHAGSAHPICRWLFFAAPSQATCIVQSIFSTKALTFIPNPHQQLPDQCGFRSFFHFPRSVWGFQ